MQNPTPPPSHPPIENIIKAKQLADAFAAVFAQPKSRSAAQRTVLEHLEKCAGEDQNSYRFGESRDGISIIGAGIHRDGAKSILRIISRQLERAAESSAAVKKAKPETKR